MGVLGVYEGCGGLIGVGGRFVRVVGGLWELWGVYEGCGGLIGVGGRFVRVVGGLWGLEGGL